jgi:hypothetical protein
MYSLTCLDSILPLFCRQKHISSSNTIGRNVEDNAIVWPPRHACLKHRTYCIVMDDPLYMLSPATMFNSFVSNEGEKRGT